MSDLRIAAEEWLKVNYGMARWSMAATTKEKLIQAFMAGASYTTIKALEPYQPKNRKDASEPSL